MCKSHKLSINLQIGPVLLLLVILLKLHKVGPFPLRYPFSKPAKRPFSSHSQTRWEAYQLQFTITWSHVCKILGFLGLDTHLGIFPDVEHASHETVDVEKDDVLVIVFQLDCGDVLFWVLCLKHETFQDWIFFLFFVWGTGRLHCWWLVAFFEV